MTSKIALPVISAQDIESLGISFSDVLELVETSFRAHGQGLVENPPKPGIHPRPQAFLHAMPACVKTGVEVAGIKWVSGYTANRDKGLPTIVGLIVLNDPDTGLPLALMDGTWITNTRTAAATGVAARCVLRGDETCVALLGCGLQGTYNALMMSLVMPHLKRLVLYDPYAPAIDKLRAAVTEQIPDLEIEVVATAEEAAKTGDVVIWAVPPVKEGTRPFDTAWLKPGATLFTVSNSGLTRDYPRKFTHITDDYAQYQSFFKGYYDLADQPPTEIGQLVTGAKQARVSPQDTVIVSPLGLAIHDMVVARHVLTLALERGLGSHVVINGDMKSDTPVPRLK